MSYYITEFNIGADSQQPHNFVKINDAFPILHMPLKYPQQPNYTKLYEWINPSEFGLNKSVFDSVLTKRKFQEANSTTVIINSSTAKLQIQFMTNDLFVETDIAKQQELKRYLLIIDHKATKPIHILNLQNKSGELWIYYLI